MPREFLSNAFARPKPQCRRSLAVAGAEAPGQPVCHWPGRGPWKTDGRRGFDVSMVQNQWYHFGIGAALILEPIFVVGLGCSLGVRVWGFDPWPCYSSWNWDVHLSSSKNSPLHPKQELCHNKAPRRQNPARRKPA